MFRKQKKKILCCVHLLQKAGAGNQKFHVAVVRRRLRNVKKSVMHVQNCCFANLNLLSKPIAFLTFSLPSPSSLLKLPIVVIQKFWYHGNVTSHFSSLWRRGAYLKGVAYLIQKRRQYQLSIKYQNTQWKSSSKKKFQVMQPEPNHPGSVHEECTTLVQSIIYQ